MNDNVIEMKEYLRLVDIKNKLDSGEIANDGIILEDLDRINNLYMYEITSLQSDVDELKKENVKLKMMKASVKDER